MKKVDIKLNKKNSSLSGRFSASKGYDPKQQNIYSSFQRMRETAVISESSNRDHLAQSRDQPTQMDSPSTENEVNCFI